MPRSRVNSRLVKQTERNLLLVIGGGIILLIIIATVGVKLLVNFSLLVEKKSDTSPSDQFSSEIIPPPILDPLTTATNSASIDITGTAGSGKYVSLYVNGRQIKKADIKTDSSFAFRDIQLEKGENSIKVKSFSEKNKESKFSDTELVVYSTKSPELSLDFPTNGETYHKDNNPIKVRGKTDKNVKVTINGFWAMIDDEGNYYYNLPLQNGENPITVEAKDEAGNQTIKSIKISYSE